MKINELKLHGKSLNKRIIAITKTIIEHYEHVYRVIIKDNNNPLSHGKIKYQKIVMAKFKFIEEAFEPFSEKESLENCQTKLYFTGISGDIYYINYYINQEAKIQSIIKFKKHIAKQQKCFGQYCNYIKETEESKEIGDICNTNRNLFKNEYYEIFGSLIK